MLRSHPHPDLQRSGAYVEVLNALSLCSQICTSCADACLAESSDDSLRRCIRANLDCADVCDTTARLVVRQTETPNDLIHSQLHTCILTCQLCADECEVHASKHDHCRICAETCRHCQQRCNFLVGEISSSGVEEDIRSTDSPPLTR